MSFRPIRHVAIVLACLLVCSGLATARTVSNVARVEWTQGDNRNASETNVVSFDVQASGTIEALRRASEGGGAMRVPASRCGAASSVAGSASPPATTERLAAATEVRAGEPMFLRITSPDADRDAGLVDRVDLTLTTTAGDRETIAVFETAEHSGVFLGSIATASGRGGAVPADCRLNVAAGGRVSIEAREAGAAPILASADIAVVPGRPAGAVVLDKQVSRSTASPGDLLLYTITVRNAGPESAQGVTLIDRPSAALRLRAGSIRIDGIEAPGAISIAPDGRVLTVRLGDIPGGLAKTLSYAMVVRDDAPAGQVVNRVIATDAYGTEAVASAAVRIERETIAARMTLIGRVTAGDCAATAPRRGIAGVRLMLEDGSFAITDAEGRYHFEGLIPGSHVVQAQRDTLPGGGARFVDCAASTRSAGSPASRFVTGQGGSLATADFHAIVGDAPTPAPADPGPAIATDAAAAGAETDWLAVDGPPAILFPGADHNPRAPAVRVVVRHRPDQTVTLSVDGAPVDRLAFDGVLVAPGGTHAVSIWRGVPLRGEATRLTAQVVDPARAPLTLERTVRFVATPARAEIVAAQSRLTADGATRPVIAVRFTDRAGRPVHAGVSGGFTLNAPYQSAAALDGAQAASLNLPPAAPLWTIAGDEGIARIELAPTMVSGALRLDFTFTDGTAQRRQTLETRIVPGGGGWTLLGLAEGTAGSGSVAAADRNARLAFYARGRMLGATLLTLAYDSARDRADQRLAGGIDPAAYDTVFADGADRRFDAASREKLYVRVENRVFQALYGDFETGFDQTELGRYRRAATGFSGEAGSGALRVAAFAARIASRHRRDEIQGNGLSGPYRLSSRRIVANSEIVAIEVRDRFRSERVIDRRVLTRFADYEIEPQSGTIRFSRPVLSRDGDLNPQFVVIDFEVDGHAGGPLTAGLRGDWTSPGGAVRLGATALTDGAGSGDAAAARTDLGAVDLKAKLGAGTELRAELATSRSAGSTAAAWLVEAEHHAGAIDALAYVRSLDADFGLDQQNRAERGRTKLGVDARLRIAEGLSLNASGWIDHSRQDAARREALELRASLRRGDSDAHIGITHFGDRLGDGRRAASTVAEAGATRRLFDNRLELEAGSSVIVEQRSKNPGGSLDLPARHRLGARLALTPQVRLIGTYEIASGTAIEARTTRVGLELTPWSGARATGTLGRQRLRNPALAPPGGTSFAAFGLAQSLAVTPRLTIDATLDANRVLGGFDAARVINPAHPVASGGFLGDGNVLGEDFTAMTLGAAWRAGRWSATLRGEARDGDLARRRGLTLGAIRQIGEGSMVGAGLTATRARTPGGAASAVIDASLAAAHRPADSPFAFLTRLEYRSDAVTGAVAGEVGPAGRTALIVDGDARSRRIVGSLSADWAPLGRDAGRAVQRSEIGLFLGVRHGFDRIAGQSLSGTSLLGGLDARIGLGSKIEIGGTATVRASLSDRTLRYAIGPQIGVSPARDVLLTVGYNLSGFRDPDFAAARSTARGLSAGVKVKFDADSFAFLGLDRRP